MKHDWKRYISPLQESIEQLSKVVDPITGESLIPPPKSDVFICRRCGSLTLGEVGGDPVDNLPGYEECDVVITKGVMNE